MSPVEVAVARFNVINKSYLTIKDINILMDCSDSKSAKYKIKFLASQERKSTIGNLIPTKEFLEFYKIDISLIQENFKIIMGVKDEWL